jgi:hypothetical protein
MIRFMKWSFYVALSSCNLHCVVYSQIVNASIKFLVPILILVKFVIRKPQSVFVRIARNDNYGTPGTSPSV